MEGTQTAKQPHERTLPAEPLHRPQPQTSLEVLFPSITRSAHYPDKSISPSALEGHGLMPGTLKLGMVWPR